MSLLQGMKSNLMMEKKQNCLVSRGADVNSNKIKVRVPLPSVCRKVEVVPSLKLGSHRKVVSSCDHHVDFLVQNHRNFKRSGEPTRIMSFQKGSWVDLEKEVFDLLKLGFTEGKSVVEVQVGGCGFLFDFYRMLQIDVVNFNQRSIAWMDVNGQPFFPKVFVDSEESRGDSVGYEEAGDVGGKENVQLNNIEIEIIISDKREDLKSLENESGSGKRKRAKEENEEVSSSNLAAKRLVIIDNAEVEKPMWPNVRVLNQEEQGYKAVQSLFLSGLGIIDPGARITKIHQCTRDGPMEKARFEVFQMQMELMKKARGDAKVVFAWYGGTANEVETILAHGFRMPTKFPSSAPYGAGVYLSPVKVPHISAMLSEADTNGEKHLILCRVILGKCEKVEAGSRQSFPSSVEYDTGVDDLTNPKWYVVWVPNMNTHVIPDCVVSFKTDGTGPVEPPGGGTMVYKLFTKLRSFLPPPKSRELQVLCTSFNYWKMGKDVFMKQLRVVVGDDMLRTVIQEINCCA